MRIFNQPKGQLGQNNMGQCHVKEVKFFFMGYKNVHVILTIAKFKNQSWINKISPLICVGLYEIIFVYLGQIFIILYF